MPTIGELLARFSFLTAAAVAGIFFTCLILVVSREWRVNVFVFAAQYFFVVLLLTRTIRLEVAAIKGLIGWLICTVFYLTERRAGDLMRTATSDSPSVRGVQRWRRWVMSAQMSFNLLAGLLVGVAAYTAALRFPLTGIDVPSDITLACYMMAGLGLLLIGLSETPMQVGFGLLTFLSGFDLLYAGLEPSLAVAGLMGAVSFVIALAMAYLRAAQAAARAAVVDRGDVL